MPPIAVAAALALPPTMLLACGDDGARPEVPGEPVSLALSADTVRLAAIGAAERLTASVSDANGVALDDATVSWASADEDIATVDTSGRVAAIGVGETEVTASAGEGDAASDVATVIVDPSAASVSVSPALIELHAIGDSIRLSATVRDANGHPVEDATVAWASDDEEVATVDADGRVVARAGGTASIEASANGANGEATVEVRQVPASVAIEPAVDTLAEGRTVELMATVADSNDIEIPDAAVAWMSFDPEIIDIDASGRATAVGWGDATVTVAATAGDASGSAEIEVLGQIAFERFTTYDGALTNEIFVMNSDGGGAIDLTKDVYGDYGPAWSPDGLRIAFTSNRDPGDGTFDDEIYVMNADGSDVRPLTDDDADDRAPAWSPDGATIAFTSDRDGNDEIYIIDADGSNPVRLTNEAAVDRNPAWSPDGSRIAFESNRDPGDGTNDYEIWVVNAGGSDPAPLTDTGGNDREPAWSPDGSKLAFVSHRSSPSGIYVIDADGSNATRLTEDAMRYNHPAWSPDGSRIAFGGDGDIYVVNADGTGVIARTDDPGYEDRPRWRPRP